MTIAKKVVGPAIGARVYLPEGPFGAAGNYPFPSFSPGEVVYGELGAEFEYVLFPVASALTLNQGDCIVWDQTGYGVQSLTGSGAHPFGAQVGFFFLGGQIAMENGLVPNGSLWSYTFQPGVYGIWCQRAGKGVINCATVNAQTKPLNTTAVAGQLNAPSAALSGSMGFQTGGVAPAPATQTFSATTTSGSAVLTGVSWSVAPGLAKGVTISGTGIPNGTVITDIQGSTVTMSNAATASGSITVTAHASQTYATTTSGSTQLTNVTSISGIFPNATLSGTGIPANTTVVSVTGTAAGGYVINMSAAATANGSSIAVTASVYIEAMINRPVIAAQN